jgi:hypothetical protein
MRDQIGHNYVFCIWKMLIQIRARVLVILLEVFRDLPLLFHANVWVIHFKVTSWALSTTFLTNLLLIITFTSHTHTRTRTRTRARARTRSWALLEKLPIVQPLKNFPVFYGTRRFITAFTRALHWSLSWARSIQSPPSHPISLRSILILSTHLRLGLPWSF